MRIYSTSDDGTMIIEYIVFDIILKLCNLAQNCIEYTAGSPLEPNNLQSEFGAPKRKFVNTCEYLRNLSSPEFHCKTVK